MKSHKQLPKFIIKNFKNGNGKVYYYDVNEDYIGESGPKVLGTQEGYYSDSTESKLNKLIETPFSSLLHEIKTCFIDGIAIEIDKGKIDIAKKFLTCLMFRSDYAYKIFIYNSYFARLLPKKLSMILLSISQRKTKIIFFLLLRTIY